MNVELLVIAKAPVPGRVKTRLCPPCTPEQAAMLAAAALADTLDAVRATPAVRRTLCLDGSPAGLDTAGFAVRPQRGTGLGARLAAAFGEAENPALLVGMDTPQLTPALLTAVIGQLTGADAVLAPAADGGWWALALRDPEHASALTDVPMSTSDTGRATLAALAARRLRVTTAATLRDVDTATDARAVAASAPGTRFAAAWRALPAAGATPETASTLVEAHSRSVAASR